MSSEITVISPALCLGIGGIKPNAFKAALKHEPDVIAVDAGSLDFGPYYLATGSTFAPRSQVKEDLSLLVPAAVKLNIPLIIGTAGGSGTREHVQPTLEILNEVARENGCSLETAVLHSDIEPSVLDQIRTERGVTPVGHDYPLQQANIEQTDGLVMQMGLEPFIATLEDEPDVILAGRSCDNAAISAYAVAQGLPKGLALHMGSILECADFAAKPKSDIVASLGSDTNANSPMIATISKDGFEIWPADDRLQCTEQSIAAHTLYERSHPTHSMEPGGVLDTSDCAFEAIDAETVRVTGSKFIHTDRYTVKIEGAGIIGQRAISMLGVRDPRLIKQLNTVLNRVRDAMLEKYHNQTDRLDIDYSVFGQDAVMRKLEPNTRTTNHELGVLVEIVADTETVATDVGSTLQMRLFHGRYDNDVPQSGAIAIPFSPNIFHTGPATKLTIHHTISVESPDEFVSTSTVEIPAEGV